LSLLPSGTSLSWFSLPGWIGCGLFVVLFFLTRTLFLDCDAPSWNTAFYQPIDEFYYTISAFNLYHYGSLHHQILSYIPDEGYAFNLLTNLLTWSSLKLCGNTYFGLRGGAVLASFLFFLLLYRLLPAAVECGKNVRQERGKGLSGGHVVWMLYLLTDFPFLMAGRIAEPTIFRTLAVLCVLALGYCRFLRGDDFLQPAWKSVLTGLVATACVEFVYPSNLFLIPAAFVATGLWAWRGGRWHVARHLAFFLAGFLLCSFVFWGYVTVFHGKNLFEEFVLHRELFSGRVQRHFSPLTILSGIRSVFRTNLFRYNPGLLFVFLVALPVFLHRTVKCRREGDVGVLSVLSFFLLQSLFTQDYPLRKHLLILPMVILLAAGAWGYREVFLAWLGQGRKRMIVFSIYWGLALLLTIYFFLRNRGLVVPGDLYRVRWFDGVCLSALVFLAGLVLNRLGGFRSGFRPLSFLAALALVLPGSAASWVFVYQSPTYVYRDALKGLAPEINGKVVPGGISYAMRLYNTSIPVLNSYAYGYSESRLQKYRGMLTQALNEETAGPVFLLMGKDASWDFSVPGLVLAESFCLDSTSTTQVGIYLPAGSLWKGQPVGGTGKTVETFSGT
jgi:hypothetical protein